MTCTKNRPVQIRAFVDQLKGQTAVNLMSLIIVDGSDSLETSQIVSQMQREWREQYPIILLKTNAGKPSGLNVALDFILANNFNPYAILFLDDDITFRIVDFVIAIEYLDRNNITGLSPLIINEDSFISLQTNSTAKERKSSLEGILTRSGDNHWVSPIVDKTREWVPTDWLPGGAAIYVWHTIKQLKFDTELENPVLGGYALGDDVDFSMRVSTLGNIGCWRRIQVIHSAPESSTRDFLAMAIARGYWKSHLLRKFPNRVSRANIFSTEFTKWVWHSLHPRMYPRALAELPKFLQGFLSNR